MSRPPSTPNSDPGTPLTERELQVLRLTANGHTTAYIAHILGLSRGTVTNIRTTTHRKLGARDTAHSIGLAIITRQLHPREVHPVHSLTITRSAA
ncbi:helix-turn-helix transcriptional regulator [Kitasatospora sp. A2-31]|uniref:helix-turn-helix domain-containing protein n=1 Tax=Kitasatospora sp. A2-31 TaxID=2916414 RepID=UPI001EEEDC84|nr:helix-turn-helix transcriptional regulator [Kitasatospora sp. A2-31]MCG6499437.1 helix-turn-helix transcriptional regulator [Kitasatospora sp. A2-31]